MQTHANCVVHLYGVCTVIISSSHLILEVQKEFQTDFPVHQIFLLILYLNSPIGQFSLQLAFPNFLPEKTPGMENKSYINLICMQDNS